jgi:hypothetical protein
MVRRTPGGSVPAGNRNVRQHGQCELVEPRLRETGSRRDAESWRLLLHRHQPDQQRGHTGIFISQNSDGSWQTAKGGGPPDGTTCHLTSRTISGSKFSNGARTLWGWFDCTKVGLPTA